MKILFITNNYTPYSGGVVSSINASVDYLHAREHAVRIVTFQFLDHHDDPEYVVRVPSLHHWQYKKNYLTLPHAYTAIVTGQIEQFKPDVLHVHHPFLLGNLARKVAQSKSIPIIFTHHTLYHHYAHYTGILAPITRRVVRRVVARFCNKIDHIIAPSTGVHSMLTVDGVKKKISVMPSGLQNSFFSGKKSNIHARIPEKIRLLYVGRLAHEKNIPFLFDVIKRLSHAYILTIVGDGPEAEYIQRCAYETYGFSHEQVHFVTKQKPEQLVAYYANADIFLFPSSSDTQALVLAEAMSQACPVIAVPGMGQEDIIVQGVNGFIISSTNQMAQKIEHIVSDDLLFRNLQREALQVARRYDQAHVGAQLESLYYSYTK